MGQLRNKLTATMLRGLGPGRHSDGAGLYIVVKESGARSWVFMWKVSGRRREMGLGSFPTVTLAKARTLADQHRASIAEGRDPLSERRSESEPTFGEAAEKFIGSIEAGWKNEKHRQQWRNTLSTYGAPITKKPVSHIGTEDVIAVLTPIWREKPETASRVRGRIERILDFAKARGWRDGPNPALWRGHLQAILPARGKLGRGHHGAMRYADVPAFLVDLRSKDATARLALEFAILTASRTGEVLGATWNEIDREKGVWTVSGSRMKAGREHRVPLVGRANQILDIQGARRMEGDADFVFPGMKRGNPLSNMALETVLRRMNLNRAALDIADAELSYGDLFRDGTEGKSAFRQKSVIMGVGLYLDATGAVPSNRMLDVYKSEDDARRVWSEVARWIVERKDHFGAFWNNATEATAAFTDAGCVIGQTWDTTGLLLNRDNPDFVYRAPKEGIITWLDSFGMLKQAPNRDQAIAFMNFMLTPEVGGMFANNTGYNSAVAGAADHASDEFKKQFNEVYTADVLGNMWWWQADTPFFAPIRNEMVEVITNA